MKRNRYANCRTPAQPKRQPLPPTPRHRARIANPRPVRPCGYPGCNTLVRDGSGRCERHRSAGTWADKTRGSRHERGYGSTWDRLRLLVLKRDCYLCQICVAMAPSRITIGNEVDHRISKAKGGTDDMENLWTVCHACHVIKTAAEKGDTVRPRIGVDGYPIE